MTRGVVIYSGGMDSFTCLMHAVMELGRGNVAALSFNYGQRHSKELEKAHAVCQKNDIAHRVVDIRTIKALLGNSSLTRDIDIPEGHYAENNMKSTVVPNRNMIMLSLAVGYAVTTGASRVYCGAHAGDHDIYPDCRAEFFDAMNNITEIANYDPVSISVPFIGMSKGDILAHGRKNLSLQAQDYADTWTCYNGRERACGKCGACVERLEGFYQLGWTDPLGYEDRKFWKQVLA